MSNETPSNPNGREEERMHGQALGAPCGDARATHGQDLSGEALCSAKRSASRRRAELAKPDARGTHGQDAHATGGQRRRAALWAIVFLAGIAVWAYFAAGAGPARAWRGLLVSFVYFIPLAAGMVVWSAILMLMNGRWAGRSEAWTLGAAAMAPLSLVAFLGLWLGRGYWATWTQDRLPGQEFWLNDTFVFTRNLAGLLLLWSLSLWYVRRRGRRRPTALAGWLALVYVLVMTVLAFDMVMSLDPKWCSSLFGGYFLISGLYGGLAAWTFAAVVSNSADVDQRHDLGKLLVAFSLITTYFMYSQLLPIWYENLPLEVRFVIPRLTEQPWLFLSVALLAAIYLGPLVLLLSRWAKRSRPFLSAVAALILVGLWAERWWLVVPTLAARSGPPDAQSAVPGLPELAVAVAFAAALALGLGRFRPQVFLDSAPREGLAP